MVEAVTLLNLRHQHLQVASEGEKKVEEVQTKEIQLRDKAYASLLQYYKSVDENATIDKVKNKINNLRSSFRKELKKVNKSKKSGSGTDEIYVPTLWYYKLLLFTSDQEEPIQPISNDEDAETENSENETDNENINSPASMVHEELEDSNITPVNSSETPIETGCSRTPSRTYTTSSRKVPASKRMLTEQREIIDKICGTLTEKDKSDEFYYNRRKRRPQVSSTK
ncbi:uncharacterized protein [Leptinotarsa decemlineata]|uniref:uncharacterized protein n=1 Tax=Leptinotarsa decemlineata TaxID=7539 RepID=UPI003D30C641